MNLIWNKIMKLILLLIISFSVMTSCRNQIEYLYPIQVNDKYGYINRKGKVVIEPEYLYASEFTEGCALIVVDTVWSKCNYKYNYGELTYKYGYINKSNKIIIDTSLIYVNDYALKNYDFLGLNELLCYNGRIKFQEKNKSNYLYEGYMDKNGNIVISPIHQYQYGTHFSNDMAAVMDENYRCGYIDINGDIIIDYIYENASEFSEGYAIVSSGSDAFIIDKKGNIQGKRISAESSLDDIYVISPFKSGVALIKADSMLYNYSPPQYMYIDKEGETHILPDGHYCLGFSEGYGAIATEKGKWYFVNTNFDCVSDYYENISSFHEGLAVVCKNGICGYINHNFELVIPYQYNSCSDFRNGLAKFSIAIGDVSIYGYINKKGKVIWQNKRFED